MSSSCSKVTVPRQEKVVELVNSAGFKTVVELAQLLSVSEQTIRRDIKTLEALGRVIRFHGGARAVEASNEDITKHEIGFITNKDISAREGENVSQKDRIAKAVSNLIPNNSVVFITIGTTVEHIAEALIGHSGVTVITNSLRVASILYRDDKIEVIIPSGFVKSSNGGIEGPNTVSDISKFRPDFVITSVGAIESDGTALDFNPNETALTRDMIKCAKHTIIACDHSKFSSVASVELINLSEIDILVTDEDPPENIMRILDKSSVQLVVAGA